MTHLAYKYIIVFVLSLVAYEASAFSVALDTVKSIDHEVRKTVHHNFQLNDGSTVILSNKYGALNIHTWDKEEVHIDVEMIASSSSKSNAEVQLKHIDIQVHNEKDYLKVVTVFLDQNKGWWANIWGSNNSELEINYDVYIPKSSKLKAENKYGDTYIEDLDNDLYASVKYGNLTTKNINGRVDLTLGYGKCIMGYIGNLDAEVKYSELFVSSAKNIHLSSKNSDLTIDKAYDMNIDSKYDSYQLGEVGDLTNEGKYDSFKIAYANSIEIDSKYSTVLANQIGMNIDAEMKYGAIEIRGVSKAFEHAEIEVDRTDVYLKMDIGFSYEIESKYATPVIAGKYRNSDSEQDGSYSYIEGTRGSNTTARVEIEAKYGSIKID